MPDSIDTHAIESRRNGAAVIAYVLKQRSVAFRIFLLVLAVAAVTLVRVLFGLLIPHAGFFAFYFPAVMIVTIMAGWRMGLACVALSAVVSTWLFLPPPMAFGRPTTAQALSIISFVVAALLQVALAQWLRSVLQQMERNENRYRQLVSATSGVVWTPDAAGRVLEPQPGWLEIAGVAWPGYAGHAWMQSIHEEDRAKLTFDWDTDASGAHHTELRVWHAPSGNWRWFAMRAVPIRDASGNRREWVTILTDVHERKLARDRRELVIGELRHRLKNLFAVIGSLVQSSRPGNEPAVDQFVGKLLGRLNALSAAADIVMARGRVSLELGEAARATLAPFMEERSQRMTIDGPPLELREETGAALTLAIHELATNAIKYGALSVPEGKVSLRWRRTPAGDGEQVEIVWKETGGPACSPPAQSGFGSRVIKYAVSREKSASVTLDYPPEGLFCRIAFVKQPDSPATAGPNKTFEDVGIL